MKIALTVILSVTAFSFPLLAQTDPVKQEKSDAGKASASVSELERGRYAACETGPMTTRFYSLGNASSQSDANDLLVALRNILCPHDKIYLAGTQNIIVIQANAEELGLAQRIISELDHPRRSYRLVYTINELENGKVIGSQHYALVAVSGQLTTLKQGSKVPLLTGSYSADNGHSATGMQAQFQYIDVGMNFAVTLDELANGVRLRSKIEQSSIGEEKVIADVHEPVIRQAVLEGAAFLTPGKSITLGSIDIMGSTRRLDVEVLLEPLR